VNDVTPTSHPVVWRMLDDIAAQFRHLPVEQAAPEIAAHIRSFWEPRMRAALQSEVLVPSGDALVDAVVTALR
jgi:formate dehydrogenase subunit delta